MFQAHSLIKHLIIYCNKEKVLLLLLLFALDDEEIVGDLPTTACCR